MLKKTPRSVKLFPKVERLGDDRNILGVGRGQEKNQAFYQLGQKLLRC